jgi:hypothetical protein
VAHFYLSGPQAHEQNRPPAPSRQPCHRPFGVDALKAFWLSAAPMPADSINMMSRRSFTRRSFLKSLGTTGLAAPFVTRGLLARPPNSLLGHASFGAAGMAWEDIRKLTQTNRVQLVAVAEVDLQRTTELKKHFPSTRIYQDWR